MPSQTARDELLRAQMGMDDANSPSAKQLVNAASIAAGELKK
jgi:hypothetical protein